MPIIMVITLLKFLDCMTMCSCALTVLLCTASFPTNLVHIAPFPVFPRLNRLDDWMVCLQKMFIGVCVCGFAATAYVTALQAEPQMHPSIPSLQAILAATRARGHFLDRVEMSTKLIHRIPLRLGSTGYRLQHRMALAGPF